MFLSEEEKIRREEEIRKREDVQQQIDDACYGSGYCIESPWKRLNEKENRRIAEENNRIFALQKSYVGCVVRGGCDI